MDIEVLDNVLVETTTTGAGTLTQLTEVDGYKAPTVDDNGKKFVIKIFAVNSSGLPIGDWEITESIYTHVGTTWSRGTLYHSSTGSRITFAAGTKRISVVFPARSIVQLDTRLSAMESADIAFLVPRTLSRVATNTAVKVELSALNFNFSLSDTGVDFLFRLTDGTPLNHYLEPGYDPVEETGVVWVNIPEVPINSDVVVLGYIVNGITPRSSFDDTFHKSVVNADTIAQYDFANTSGSIVQDSGANNLDGDLVGTPTLVADILGFSTGQALQLNGTTQYFKVNTLLNAYPPSITISFAFRPTSTDTNNATGDVEYTLISKAWTATTSIKLSILNRYLVYTDETIGAIYSNAQHIWTVGTTYVITLKVTPISLRIDLANMSTGVNQTVLETWEYAYKYRPPPDASSKRYTTYPPGAPQPFTLGCDLSTGTAGSFTPGKFSHLIGERRLWSKNETTFRAVRLTSHIPDDEVTRWTKHPATILAPPGGSWFTGTGEFDARGYDPVRDRIWTTFTGNAAIPSIGIAYSDDGGETWVHPFNHPIVGNGNGGVAGGQYATHSSMFWEPLSVGGDDYMRIYWSQQDASIRMAKSVLPFSDYAADPTQIEFELIGEVLNASEFTGDTNVFYNSSVRRGPGGVVYMLVDSIVSVFRMFMATHSSSPDGPFTALQATALSFDIDVDNNENSDSQLDFDPGSDLLHAWIQYADQPCEVFHQTSPNGTTWTRAAVDGSASPAVALEYGDGVATGAGSVYADQMTSPNPNSYQRLDGTVFARLLVSAVNNIAVEGRVFLYKYEGSSFGINAARIPIKYLSKRVLPSDPVPFANPTGLIGMAAVNGVATTALRSDARHAIDPAIWPDWTGIHTFSAVFPYGPAGYPTDALQFSNKGYVDVVAVGKAATGAVAASGLTFPASSLVGRFTASVGAAESITIGSGLALSGAGVLSATGGGGDTLPVVDTTAIAKGSADATKIVRLECDSFIPTATTVVLTVPVKSGTIAILEQYDSGNQRFTGLQDFILLSAGTNDIQYPTRTGHNSTGAPAAGFGVGHYFLLKTTTTNDSVAGKYEVTWLDATAGSARSRFRSYTTDAAPWVEVDDTTGGQLITFEGAVVLKPVAAAYATSLTLNCDASTEFDIAELTGNITINNPNGTPRNGQKILLNFKQDATGGRTYAFGTNFAFTDDVTNSLTTTASKYASILFRYTTLGGRNKWVAQAVNNG